jgi:hypothetical protein
LVGTLTDGAPYPLGTRWDGEHVARAD